MHQVNGEGDTPLHVLARTDKCTSAAAILVEAGCDLEIKNKMVRSIQL